MKRYHHLFWTDGNIEHIAEHNISPDEVEQAIYSSSCRKRKGRGQEIDYVFGQTDTGRYLFVVLRDLREGVAFPITARDMSKKERKYYRSLL